MGQKPVTIKHIAAQLQISQGLVCRALRDDILVKNSTKEKVREMAEQLGYIKDWRNYAKYRKKKSSSILKLPNPANKEATIYDIAEKLNISAATVSRALNGSDKVKETTLQKVLEVASALEYSVNMDARDLRAKTTTSHQYTETIKPSASANAETHEVFSKKVISIIKELDGVVLYEAINILKEVEKEITSLSRVSFNGYQQYLELTRNNINK